MTAPAALSTTPRVTRYQPLYRCLGYVENAQGYRRYVIAFGDPERVVIRRVGEMTGLEFLLTIYADPGPLAAPVSAPSRTAGRCGLPTSSGVVCQRVQ